MKSGYHTYMTSASFFYISRLQNVSWLSANLSHLSLSSTHFHLCFDVISERPQRRRRGRAIIMCRQTTGGAPFCARVAVQGSERAPRLWWAASRSTPSFHLSCAAFVRLFVFPLPSDPSDRPFLPPSSIFPIPREESQSVVPKRCCFRRGYERLCNPVGVGMSGFLVLGMQLKCNQLCRSSDKI